MEVVRNLRETQRLLQAHDNTKVKPIVLWLEDSTDLDMESVFIQMMRDHVSKLVDYVELVLMAKEADCQGAHGQRLTTSGCLVSAKNCLGKLLLMEIMQE